MAPHDAPIAGPSAASSIADLPWGSASSRRQLRDSRNKLGWSWVVLPTSARLAIRLECRDARDGGPLSLPDPA
jgi:hypothetical protein